MDMRFWLEQAEGQITGLGEGGAGRR
jgi:hypothetical protein